MEVGITVKVGEIELKLTQEQVRTLFGTLKTLFSDKTFYVQEPVVIRPYLDNWWETGTTCAITFAETPHTLTGAETKPTIIT